MRARFCIRGDARRRSAAALYFYFINQAGSLRRSLSSIISRSIARHGDCFREKPLSAACLVGSSKRDSSTASRHRSSRSRATCEFQVRAYIAIGYHELPGGAYWHSKRQSNVDYALINHCEIAPILAPHWHRAALPRASPTFSTLTIATLKAQRHKVRLSFRKGIKRGTDRSRAR